MLFVGQELLTEIRLSLGKELDIKLLAGERAICFMGYMND